jgi:arginine repressor
MARQKTKEPSRSQAVRDFMRKNGGATVPQIVDGLKAEGVTVTPGLVYNVQAGVRKKRSAKRTTKKTAAATKSNGRPSSNGSADTTKAERIRQVAQAMKKPVRPRDVIAALAAEGISVSSAQVSTTLRAMGMRRRRRGRKTAGAAPSRPAVSTSELLSLDSLLAAKKLVTQLGSVSAAKQAVDALAKLR